MRRPTCPIAPRSKKRCSRRWPAETEGSALAYLDLDHFTLINDTASHAAGDALIHGIGSLLKARLRAGDQVFRIGGDEFALLLTGDADTMELRLQHLQRAVENYRVGWQDHVLNITVSIGLVTFKAGRDRIRAPAVAGRRRLLHRQGTGRQPRGAGQPETGRDA